VSLPRTKDAILHLEHYQGKTTLEVLNLRMGALNSCRSTVENLLLGVTGVGGVTVPLVIVFPALALAAATAVWAVWGSRRPALPLTGLALIGASYLLTYSARAEWTYEGVMNQPNWSRYHLLPQLGLSFLVAGALSRRAERWRMDAAGRLTRRQVLGLSVLGLLLFVTQLPRGLVACCWLHRADGHLVITWQRWHDSQAQHEALRRIEAVDAVCRQQRIDAKLVPLAVGTLHDAMPLDCPTEDNWQFLRGSDDPDPAVTVEQVQRWLESAGYGNGAEPQ
jgi:hypothetical protein